MKGALLIAFLLWQTAAVGGPAVSQIDAMRYERALRIPAKSGQVCAVLDGQIFPHAGGSLADLRIFATGPGGGGVQEIPYAVTESEVATEETQGARVLNLGGVGGNMVFDLEMPQRAYTDVRLEFDPAVENFVATATVTGLNELHGGAARALGSFTLFDLRGQHLSRDTTLRLGESTFRYLHVVMRVVSVGGAEKGGAARFAAGMIESAEVPPSREAQILYTTVAKTPSVAATRRESRAEFELPVRVPVERVSFVLAPGYKGNFSREVRVTAFSETKRGADTRAVLPEVVVGRIMRVHAREGATEIRRDELSVPAILGANLQGAAKVEVAIENGDEQALPVVAVRLEMRQREVCFDATTAGARDVALFYGDPALAGPVYGYERLLAGSDKATVAQLGTERLNAAYRAPVEAARPFVERHPREMWGLLIGVIGVLGAWLYATLLRQ